MQGNQEDSASFYRDHGRTLTVYCKNGLCNRLYVLLSARVLAEETDRHFRMFWPRTSACAARFSDLFENSWNILEQVPDELTQSRSRSFFSYQPIPDLVQSQDPHPVFDVWGMLIAPKRYSGHARLQRSCGEQLAMLRPVEPVRRAVDSFKAGHFRPTMIGVHLRRGDFKKDYPSTQIAPDLQAVLENVDRYLEISPDAGILLCTDDGAIHPRTKESTGTQGVKECFLERFPNRVVFTQPTSLDRNEMVSIQEALVDLLLLREVDYFVGTQGSTFSGIAVFEREIPRVFVSGARPDKPGQHRLAKLTGVYYLVMLAARKQLSPEVPFDYAWNVWLRWKYRKAVQRYTYRCGRLLGQRSRPRSR